MGKMNKLSAKLSFGEEVANSITHGIGALAMLILFPISVVYTYKNYDIKTVIGISIFILSIFFMFLSSTIYHAMPYNSQPKYILRIIDHSMIYIAIAGSYTPIALSLVEGWLGYLIIVLQWGITIFGILYKALAKNINEKFSLTLYLIMGWFALFIIPVIIKKASFTFILLILFGGIAYTIGAIFYAKKKPYFHMIWHLFILLASGLQYVAIVFYMQ